MTQKEFGHIVDEYANRLCRFADKLLVNKEQAKDVTQDTFTKLWEHRNNIDVSKLKSWLFAVSYNECMGLLRNQKRMVYDHDFKNNYHHAPESSDLKSVIKTSLEMLSDVQKSILLLRDYEGYNYDEIGDILNLSESQVKVYLFRARQKMKDYLKDIDLVI